MPPGIAWVVAYTMMLSGDVLVSLTRGKKKRGQSGCKLEESTND